jgi:hypothetical protein
MALAIAVRILAVRTFSVADPDVSIRVDVQPVRADEHAGAEALHQLARGIELLDGRQVRADTTLSAASIEDPDAAAVAIDMDAGRGSDFSPLGELEKAVDGLIRAGKGVDRTGITLRGRRPCRQRGRDHDRRQRQTHST